MLSAFYLVMKPFLSWLVKFCDTDVGFCTWFWKILLIFLLYLVFAVHSTDAPPPTWEQLENGLVAVRTVVHGLVDYIQNHSKKGTDQQQVKAKSFGKYVPLSYIGCFL